MTTSQKHRIDRCDPVWSQVRIEAEATAESEPILASFLHSTILDHDSLESVILHRLSQRLGHHDVSFASLRQALNGAVEGVGEFSEIIRADLAAVFDRDPACNRLIDPLLYFKGFHALETHRLANSLWKTGRRDFAQYLQSMSSSVFTVDIHPAARIGRGIMFDHASGVVIGETAVIGDNSSLLHGVTLGGSGKESGDRHPKIGSNVMIGAGAKILGNIHVGDCARVAAGSVVLKDVPPQTTVAGVPAKVVGPAGCPEPARTMNQMLGLDDAN